MSDVYDVMKLLDATANIEQIQKKFKLAGASTDIDIRRSTAVSTGLLMTDVLLNGGIYPSGWYTFFGPEQSAKSTHMMSVMVNLVESNVPIVLYFDAEGCVTEDVHIRCGGRDLRISDLVDSVLPYEEKRRVVDGGKTGFILPDKFTVDTVGRENVEARLFYGGNRTTTKVHLRNGSSIEGHNHPMMTLRNGEMKWHPIEYVGLGDRIATANHGFVEIERVERSEKSKPVWDVSILDHKNHDYPHSIITNGIITGNSTSPDYLEAIAGSISAKREFSAQNVFGIKDRKTGKWAIEPRIWYSPENSIEGIWKASAAVLRRLPDKVYAEGSWWLLYENTRENMSRFKGQTNTAMGKKYGKVVVPSIDEGAAQALILIDSYPSMVSDSQNTDDGDNALGVEARGHSRHGKLVKGMLKRKHATVLGVNQLRDSINIGNPYGPKEYEPAGNWLKYASDVRISQRPRAVPHASGQLEEEDSVLFDQGKDTYRYICMKTIKNKFGSPHLEAWYRVWLSDPMGQGLGLCPVYDTWAYLKATGQAKGTMRKFTIIMDLKSSHDITGSDLRDYAYSLGFDKNPKIRQRCFAQLASGKGLEMFYSTLNGSM